MTKMSITLDELKAFNPCIESFRKVLPLFEGRKSVSLRMAVKSGVPLSDLLWIIGRKAPTDTTLTGLLVQFALDCTGQVHKGDNPPAYWLQVTAACAPIIAALIEKRKPTQEQISATYAAYDAAYAAADAAADDTVYAAAYTADAARAARAAANAARAAYAANAARAAYAAADAAADAADAAAYAADAAADTAYAAADDAAYDADDAARAKAVDWQRQHLLKLFK